MHQYLLAYQAVLGPALENQSSAGHVISLTRRAARHEECRAFSSYHTVLDWVGSLAYSPQGGEQIPSLKRLFYFTSNPTQRVYCGVRGELLYIYFTQY